MQRSANDRFEIVSSLDPDSLTNLNTAQATGTFPQTIYNYTKI